MSEFQYSCIFMQLYAVSNDHTRYFFLQLTISLTILFLTKNLLQYNGVTRINDYSRVLLVQYSGYCSIGQYFLAPR